MDLPKGRLQQIIKKKKKPLTAREFGMNDNDGDGDDDGLNDIFPTKKVL